MVIDGRGAREVEQSRLEVIWMVVRQLVWQGGKCDEEEEEEELKPNNNAIHQSTSPPVHQSTSPRRE